MHRFAGWPRVVYATVGTRSPRFIVGLYLHRGVTGHDFNNIFSSARVT